ncbi:MAG: DUF4160 domain-containing protein [Rhizomicrobium sp.]
MVTVYRGPNWKISVYGREHGVPHFRVEGVEFRCSVAIATLETIIGTAPAPVLTQACAWAAGNREFLFAKWRELNG